MEIGSHVNRNVYDRFLKGSSFDAALPLEEFPNSLLMMPISSRIKAWLTSPLLLPSPSHSPRNLSPLILFSSV